MCKNYSNVILADVSQLVENYMSLVKNFPLVFNGSKIKQNIDQLMNQMKTVILKKFLKLKKYLFFYLILKKNLSKILAFI